MGDYTKLRLEEANKIGEMYALEELSELTPLSLGISNSNYKLVTPSQTYLLKVSNDKNIEQLTGEMKLLHYLNQCGYPYSLLPFSTSEDKLVYELGEKFGVLFPFLDGIPPGPSDIACEEIGKGLATLHSLNHSDEIKEIRDHEEVGFGAPEVYDFTKTSSCPQDFKELFNLMFPHQLTWFKEFNWERGIIHGDLYSDNSLFKSEHLQVFLDWEQGGRGEYLVDLGISISGTCLEKGRLNPSLIKSYLRGYEAIRPLPKEEKAHLVDAIALGLFSISLWRIKRFKEKNLNPLMAESYRELLLRAEIFNETL
ncbi:MAG: phosphotransferase, partial [Halobacteriovoraceae bacterium]|nr:phosphotransferase [Halobacteriovoraceae bacterium]